MAAINFFADHRLKESAKSGRKRASGAPVTDHLTILEGLAASGLRAIRYAKEIKAVEKVVANDLDPNVVDAMKRNIEFNGPEVLAKVVPSVGDARIVMMQNDMGFDVVDLDPYGSPTRLLDAAVQSVADGGLLLVTATDMAVLCGNNGDACYAKYGSYPLHRPYCHEQAIRIVLGSLATAAARHKRYIVPVLSLSIDFYVRMFMRVYSSPAESKNAALKMGYVYQSQGCDSFYWQRAGRKISKGASVKYAPGFAPPVPQQCPETGSSFTMGGPMWADPIHDPDWIKGILELVTANKERYAAFEKIQGLLTSASEELHDVPLYLNLHDVCKTLRATPMKAETFRSALLNAGYRVSGTHCNPLGVKTDAPWTVVWDIMRCWVKDHPVRPIAGSGAEKILSKEPTLTADFSRAPGALVQAKKGKGKVPRFPRNPEAHWGPKMKHGRVGKQQQQGTKRKAESEAGNDGDQQHETT